MSKKSIRKQNTKISKHIKQMEKKADTSRVTMEDWSTLYWETKKLTKMIIDSN